MTARIYDMQTKRDERIIREIEQARGIVGYPTQQSSHAKRCTCRECRLARAKVVLGEDAKDCVPQES